MFADIEEWKPVLASPQVSQTVIFIQALMVIVALLAWRLNPHRRTAHLVWLLLMGFAYISARRNGGLLGLAALAVMAANAGSLQPVYLWQTLWPGWAQRKSSIIPLRWHLFAEGSTLLVLYILILRAMPGGIYTPSFRAVSTRLCSKMASFIEDKRLTGHLFNDYETSSYLQWRFAGRRPLFVDLLNAYPVDLLRTYDQIAGATPTGLRKLEDLHIGIVTFGWQSRPHFMYRLLNFLDHSPRWVRVYNEKDGAVWVRRTPENAHLW